MSGKERNLTMRIGGAAQDTKKVHPVDAYLSVWLTRFENYATFHIIMNKVTVPIINRKVPNFIFWNISPYILNG